MKELLDDEGVRTLLDLAIREDVGSGDATSQAIFPQPRAARARIVARTPTVVCGLPLVAALYERLGGDVSVEPGAAEGDEVAAGATVARLQGDVRALLAGERVALNFLMRLCGIATAARRACALLPPTTELYDTRKTTPGWRLLEKAAVRAGGARNHRMGLWDAVLIKDNHVAAAGSVGEAVRRGRATGLPVTVEIDGLDQLDEALDAKPDVILLDNFSLADLKQAVERTRGAVPLEASGGVTPERLAAIAATGVQRVSMGALTHTVQPADLSMELDAGPRFEVTHVGEVDSTMLEARRRAEGGARQGLTVVAESQTAGRGRRGRTWYSESGAGLFLTTVLEPSRTEALHTLALVAGVAVLEAAERLGARGVALKWPNDLVVDGKKLAGVLLESDLQGGRARVFIGIGLNLTPARSAPDELRRIYVSLAEVAGRSVARELALTVLVEQLERRYSEWLVRGPAPALLAWRSHDALAGKKVRAENGGGVIEGTAEGIDDGGRLRLRRDGSVVLISAGDVLHVR